MTRKLYKMVVPEIQNYIWAENEVEARRISKQVIRDHPPDWFDIKITEIDGMSKIKKTDWNELPFYEGVVSKADAEKTVKDIIEEQLTLKLAGIEK